MMNAVRWQVFKWLSALGWAICPEPQRSDLQGFMPSWQKIEATTNAINAAIRARKA